MKRIAKFITENKKEILILLLIVLIGAFLRLYKIDQYLTFLGDEGRDVIIVRRFLTEGDVFLIGPGTSIGNMYLGPFYYYMMAPALLLAGFSPVGPAVQIAVLSLVTMVFMWWVGREWFDSKAGLIAAFLYAISPTVVIYSRSSWNPNIMPFFALACIYAIWRVFKKDQHFWLPILGFSFAAVLQSHYLGLLLAPTLGVVWLASWYVTDRKKNFFIYSVFGGLVWMTVMSPLVIFDARHGWRNFDAIKIFFTERQTTVSARPWNAIPDMWPLFQEITTRLVAARQEVLGMWTALMIVLATFFVFSNEKARSKLTLTNILAFSLIFLWLGTALAGLGLYKQNIYDHYYGFFFPAPFLLIGGLSYVLIKHAKIRGAWLVLTGLVFLIYFNLTGNALTYGPNRQLQRSVEVADIIIRESNGEKFNLAVIAERNYEDAYEYFLLKNNASVVDIDPQNSEKTITDQLFVVCELPKDQCDPTHNAKTEVANFGWSEIDGQWDTAGVNIYKLVHTKQ